MQALGLYKVLSLVIRKAIRVPQPAGRQNYPSGLRGAVCRGPQATLRSCGPPPPPGFGPRALAEPDSLKTVGRLRNKTAARSAQRAGFARDEQDRLPPFLPGCVFGSKPAEESIEDAGLRRAEASARGLHRSPIHRMLSDACRGGSPHGPKSRNYSRGRFAFRNNSQQAPGQD